MKNICPGFSLIVADELVDELKLSLVTFVSLFLQDEAKAQRATKQKNTLESVEISVKLLDDMLAHYNPDKSTDGDKELIKVPCL